MSPSRNCDYKRNTFVAVKDWRLFLSDFEHNCVQIHFSEHLSLAKKIHSPDNNMIIVHVCFGLVTYETTLKSALLSWKNVLGTDLESWSGCLLWPVDVCRCWWDLERTWDVFSF